MAHSHNKGSGITSLSSSALQSNVQIYTEVLCSIICLCLSHSVQPNLGKGKMLYLNSKDNRMCTEKRLAGH